MYSCKRSRKLKRASKFLRSELLLERKMPLKQNEIELYSNASINNFESLSNIYSVYAVEDFPANGYCSKRTIFDLNGDIFHKIFSDFADDELIPLRLLCSQMKSVVDFELTSRRNKLVIDHKLNDEQQLQFELSLSHTVRDLQIIRSVNNGLNFEQLMNLLENNVPLVESLKVHDLGCNNLTGRRICDIFSHISSLSLYRVDLNDSAVSNLFQNLQHLNHISIQFLPITGICFSDIRENLNSIEWCVEEHFELRQDLSLNGKGSQIKQFTFTKPGEVGALPEGNKVVDLVSREMKNLSSIGIDVEAPIIGDSIGVSCLSLDEVLIAKSGLKFTKKLPAIKKVVIKKTISDRFDESITMFPKLSIVEIILDDSPVFTFDVIETLMIGAKSLQSTTSYVVKDGVINVIVEQKPIGEESMNGSKLSVRFCSEYSKRDINATATKMILKKIASVATKRSDVEFLIKWNFKEDSVKLPSNIKVRR